jgi:hypothetical protein
MQQIVSFCCVFTSHCLVMARNALDSSASMFMSLLATDCFIAPLDHFS